MDAIMLFLVKKKLNGSKVKQMICKHSSHTPGHILLNSLFSSYEYFFNHGSLKMRCN